MPICANCNQDTEHYAHSTCKSCYMVQYRKSHSDEYRAKRATAERERRKRLGDELRQKDRERNKQRREYRIAYCRAYYAAHKEQFKKKHQEWRKNNPELANIRKRRYQLRKAELMSTLTIADWQAIKDGFDHRCVYCNRQMQRLTQEHIIPVTKGGAYTPDNIVPACGSCNSRKHTQDAFAFLLRSHADSTSP